jgi:hypothetical protein
VKLLTNHHDKNYSYLSEDAIVELAALNDGHNVARHDIPVEIKQTKATPVGSTRTGIADTIYLAVSSLNQEYSI